MPLLYDNNMKFELENFDDDDDDDDYDEHCHGLLIRRKTSYTTRVNKSSSKTSL
ncbi:unnamed protein product, partial [Rotaria sordida]